MERRLNLSFPYKMVISGVFIIKYFLLLSLKVDDIIFFNIFVFNIIENFEVNLTLIYIKFVYNLIKFVCFFTFKFIFFLFFIIQLWLIVRVFPHVYFELFIVIIYYYYLIFHVLIKLIYLLWGNIYFWIRNLFFEVL